jgi:transcription antitermination protein NusB
MTSASADKGQDQPGKSKPRKADLGGRAGARSAARLAAVQGLYQVQISGQSAESVLREFVEHRFRAEGDSDYRKPDTDLFCDVMRGASARKSELDPMIGAELAEGWRLERLERVMQALLLSGTYELVARPDVPTAVIINEYVDLAHAFFEADQARFAHAVLDKIAAKARPGIALPD